jgi:hypothetical protein
MEMVRIDELNDYKEEDRCLCGFDDTVTYTLGITQSDSEETTYRENLCVFCYEYTLKKALNKSRSERGWIRSGVNVQDEETVERKIMDHIAENGWSNKKRIMANIKIGYSLLGKKMKALEWLGFVNKIDNQSDAREVVYLQAIENYAEMF